MATKKVYLFASRPDAVSSRLAQDNSYVDLEFDFGIYGDIAHTTAVTPEHFGLSFYREDGHATAATITSVRRPDNSDEAQAPPLVGGETAVRLFLNITGSPSGAEAIVIRPAAKPIYNAIGNATSAYTTQFADELSLTGATG